jgi:hypothetical protein
MGGEIEAAAGTRSQGQTFRILCDGTPSRKEGKKFWGLDCNEYRAKRELI